MNIEDVKFDKRDTRYGEQVGLYMPGGHWVMEETFIHAYASIRMNWSSIDWSRKPTAKAMIGIERWGMPDQRGLNIALGRCVKYFVTHDMLPQSVVVAVKRDGTPYKGGSVKYALAAAT